VASTATYQATFTAFEQRGLTRESAAALMLRAVRLAMQARDAFWEDPANRNERRRPLIAASIGPYGAMLADGSEYRGRYSVSDQELRNFHRPRLELLAGSGADLLAFETIPCLREALVLAALLEEFPRMTAWLCFSCRDGKHNCEGEDIQACARALEPFAQIAAIGVNCTAPDVIGSLLQRMGEDSGKPLVAYPNSGERYDAGQKIWEGGPAADCSFADLSRSWYEAGARLIGGCCRTTPADIRAIRTRYVAHPTAPKAPAAPAA
jgi:homocysteine S-methyltransferase